MTTILVTGGGRGIGRELVRQAMGRGYRVFTTVRELPADAVADATYLRGVDMLRPETLPPAFAKLEGVSIDVVVNNAGIIGPARQSTLDMDFDGFRQTLEVNTLAPLRVAQALLANLRAASAAKGIAKLVTISSQMGRMNYAKSDRIAYRASKTAVNKIMQGLATDLAPEAIAVQSIDPGWARTAMGGPDAAVEVEDSVGGILDCIERLDMNSTGSFVDFQGNTVSW